MDWKSDLLRRIQLNSGARNPETGCIEWTGTKTPFGYGRIAGGGKDWRAHRAVWVLAHGDVGPDVFICHHCDNPACVNIEHLYAGTSQTNVDDMINRRRHVAFTQKEQWAKHVSEMSKVINRKGSRNGMHKLTEADVIAIRASGVQTKYLQEKYGISRCQVQDIRAGRRWKHVPMPPSAEFRRLSAQ